MPTTADRRLTGVLLAMGAALTWSSAGVGIKLLPLGPLTIAGFRSLFALPILLFALLWRGKAARSLTLYRFALRQPAVWGAALAYALCVTLFVCATKLTTAANAILLQYSAPIFVALLSWPLLGERVRGIDWLAVLGCLAGVGWCFADQLSVTGGVGNLIALGSGLAFGMLPLLLRRQLRQSATAAPTGEEADYARYLSLFSLVLGNALSALVALPWMISGLPHSGTAWLGLGLLGTVQIGAAYLLYAAAVRRLRAIECLLATTLEPILNPVWVALWAHERPGTATLLGGGVILLTVVVHGLLVSRSKH
jgi:drug/metabolite transporter (DMT)-like permease